MVSQRRPRAAAEEREQGRKEGRKEGLLPPDKQLARRQAERAYLGGGDHVGDSVFAQKKIEVVFLFFLFFGNPILEDFKGVMRN